MKNISKNIIYFNPNKKKFTNWYLFSKTHVIRVLVVIEIEYNILDEPWLSGLYENTLIFIY